MSSNGVGIITFHDTANHGAALQTYATFKAIESLGYNAVVIDYSNSARQSIYEPFKRFKAEVISGRVLPAIKTIMGYKVIRRRLASFNDFYYRNIKLSDTRYSESSNFDALNKELYKVVCGSDQIWSLMNNGNDLNYLLDFVEDSAKKISYASSLGMDSIPKGFIERYKKALCDFSHLSVREKTGANILEQILDREVKLVLDPVFLLSAAEWQELAIRDIGNKNERAQDYLLDYSAQSGVLEEFLSIPGVRNEFRLVKKFGTNLRPSDFFVGGIETYPSAGPSEFVQVLSRAKFIHTTSFHGTVLAIIFKKNFIARLSGNPGRDSRIIDLLETFDLSDRIYKDGMPKNELFKAIDYEKVSKKLEVLRGASLDFLRNALSS